MLKNIHIKNYRGIKDLEIKDFKRINLFVGDNNSGKTSVLEAIGSGVNYNIIPIFNFDNLREVGLPADLSKISVQDPKYWDNLEYLVYKKNKDGFTIDLEKIIDEKIKKIKLHGFFSNEAENFTEKQVSDPKAIIINQNLLNSFIAVYESDNEKIKLGFSRNGTYSATHNSHTVTPVSIISSNTTKAYELVYPMQQIAKENGEKFFCEIAQKIDPSIKGIKIAGDDVLADIGDISIPLKYVGDGLINILNILLKARYSKNGILIVDEIENGLHWKSQKLIWRELIKISKENDTQIFATTHSYDTIKALSEAYEEVKDLLGDDEIRLFKIKKLNTDETILGSIDCEVLQAKIEDNIEIR
jgi:AAA15 family ATPase/GTPase